MRAAELIVSPKRRYLGNFVPITPASIGPLCAPILYLTLFPWSSKSCRAALSNRSSKGPWPRSSQVRMSSGKTPTQATYSSPTVSIFVTLLSTHTLSMLVNCSFKKRNSCVGVFSRVCRSKSSMTRIRIDTCRIDFAMGSSGLVNICGMTCDGTMNSKIANIRFVDSACCMSCLNLVRCPRSNMYFVWQDTNKTPLSKNTRYNVSSKSYTASFVTRRYIVVQPMNTHKIQTQMPCMCTTRGITQGVIKIHVMSNCTHVCPCNEQSTWWYCFRIHWSPAVEQ
mmetsp:Transcript_109505/g.316573  ORF Transcript_109505/g.316573 Transcript_109505/m.316573 type:complete len:281 (+) Transcript_109505:1892-2734(+)